MIPATPQNSPEPSKVGTEPLSPVSAQAGRPRRSIGKTSAFPRRLRRSEQLQGELGQAFFKAMLERPPTEEEVAEKTDNENIKRWAREQEMIFARPLLGSLETPQTPLIPQAEPRSPSPISMARSTLAKTPAVVTAGGGSKTEIRIAQTDGTPVLSTHEVQFVIKAPHGAMLHTSSEGQTLGALISYANDANKARESE